MFNDLEKTFGMKVQALNKKAAAKGEDGLTDEVVVFQEVIKQTFGDLRKQARDTVDNLRTREHETFSRITVSRASNRGGNANKRMDLEVIKLKDKIE